MRIKTVRDIEGMILKIIKNQLGREKFILYYLTERWQLICGENIAKNSFPVKLEAGILTLTVTSSGWAHNLLLLKPEILGKINNLIQEKAIKGKNKYKIKDLFFYNGAIKKKSERERANDKLIVYEPLEEQEKKQIIEKLGKINDSNLKRTFYKIMENDKKRKTALYKISAKKCHECGVPIPKTEVLCTACLRKQKLKLSEKLIELIYAAPWLSYDECINYVKCDKILFDEVKNDIKFKIYQKVADGHADHNDNVRAALIYSGVAPENLDDERIEEIVKRLRRKKSVPSSWG